MESKPFGEVGIDPKEFDNAIADKDYEQVRGYAFDTYILNVPKDNPEHKVTAIVRTELFFKHYEIVPGLCEKLASGDIRLELFSNRVNDYLSFINISGAYLTKEGFNRKTRRMLDG